jgi:hypothetical protein
MDEKRKVISANRYDDTKIQQRKRSVSSYFWIRKYEKLKLKQPH